MNVKRYYPKRGLHFWPLLLLLVTFAACKKGPAGSQASDYDSSATSYTKDRLEAVHEYLNWEDQADSLFANYGHLADLTDPDGNIYEDINGESRAVYNTKDYAFCSDTSMGGHYPPTVNPSLWRQSYLNQISGLFELIPNTIFQIRGFDLANMSIVKDGEGNWIVIDPLGSPGTAKAGIDLFNSEFKKRHGGNDIQISTIIFTHSHIDHFGGVDGLQQYLVSNLDVYGPAGFFEEAVSENVMAGNCMGRRASYMYGNLLQKGVKGTLGSGLGTISSSGIPGIKALTHPIDNDDNNAARQIHGLDVRFWNAPGSEAPAEMIFYFPTYKAFCQAEDMNHTLHNLLTLRGAKVRNGLAWSKYIDKAVELWGDEVELSFGSHHWPMFDTTIAGREISVKRYWEEQRDLYRFIHDQTLRLANQGYTMHELADMIHLPTALDKQFHARGYYGTVNHDVKAQYQLYFGWFDGNPANLNPLPPHQAGEAYVNYIGKGVIDSAAQVAYNAGDYRFAAELWNKLVFADDKDMNVREKLARAYDQMGYEAESGPWRNFYLTAAHELRSETLAVGPAPAPASPDIIANMSTELLLDYLAMKFKGNDPEAGAMRFDFNLEIFPDQIEVGEPEIAALIVSNGAVTVRIDKTIGAFDTRRVQVSRKDINDMMSMGIPLLNLVQTDQILFPGPESCKADFEDFAAQIDIFEFWFNIVTD